MSPRWRKVLGDLGRRRTRTVLAVLSLAIGLVALGSLHLAGDEITTSFEADFAEVNPPSAVMTVDPFPASLVDEVRAREEVGQVEGRRRQAARIRSGDGEWRTAELVSMPSLEDNRVAVIEPTRGAWPPPPGTIALERVSADLLGVAPGDVVRVEAPGRPARALRVTGEAKDFYEVPPVFPAAPLRGYLSPATMAEVSGSTELNALFIRSATDPLDRDTAIATSAVVRDEVLAPAGLAVERSEIVEPGEHRMAQGVEAMVTTLRLLSTLVLVLACVLVVNTVLALLAEQRRQVGVMKAVGATSRQVAGVFLAYVFAIELAALAIAIPTTIVVGRWIGEYFTGIINNDLGPLSVPWTTIGIQLGVAVVVPTLAVAVGVWRASRRTVREAISDYGISAAGPTGALRVDVLAPRRRLALRNTVRSRSRVVLTLATLALTGALLVGILSTDRALGRLSDRVLGYSGYDIELTMTESVPVAEIARIVRGTPGVAGVEGWLLKDAFLIRADGTENENVILTGAPPDSPSLRPTVLDGRWPRPGERGIAVNEELLADEPQLSIGDSVVLDVEGARGSWPIVGTVSRPLTGPQAFVPASALSASLDEPGRANLIAVTTAPGEDPSAVGEDIERSLRAAGAPLARLETRTGLREQTSGPFGLIVGTLLVVTGLLGVVAIVGVTGTMTLGVLERTREVGVLRAIGATSRTIAGLLLTEALAIALAGWLLGAALAIPMSWMLETAIGEAFVGAPLPFALSLPAMLLWLAAAIAVGVLAALRPAWMAARLTIRETLAYE